MFNMEHSLNQRALTEPKIKKPVWIKDMGDFHTMPEPYRKLVGEKKIRALQTIIQREFETEYRQINCYKGNCEVKIFWMSDKAYALHIDDGRLEIYRIGCEHKNMIRKEIYTNVFEEVCPECGYKRRVDEGD